MSTTSNVMLHIPAKQKAPVNIRTLMIALAYVMIMCPGCYMRKQRYVRTPPTQDGQQQVNAHNSDADDEEKTAVFASPGASDEEPAIHVVEPEPEYVHPTQEVAEIPLHTGVEIPVSTGVVVLLHPGDLIIYIHTMIVYVPEIVLLIPARPTESPTYPTTYPTTYTTTYSTTTTTTTTTTPMPKLRSIFVVFYIAFQGGGDQISNAAAERWVKNTLEQVNPQLAKLGYYIGAKSICKLPFTWKCRDDEFCQFHSMDKHGEFLRPGVLYHDHRVINVLLVNHEKDHGHGHWYFNRNQHLCSTQDFVAVVHMNEGGACHFENMMVKILGWDGEEHSCKYEWSDNVKATIARKSENYNCLPYSGNIYLAAKTRVAGDRQQRQYMLIGIGGVAVILVAAMACCILRCTKKSSKKRRHVKHENYTVRQRYPYE